MKTVTSLHPWIDYTLTLSFSDNKKGVFDMKPYLNTGIFKELQDEIVFNTARVSFGTVEWQNGADFDPESLYIGSYPLANIEFGSIGTVTLSTSTKCHSSIV